LICFFGDRLKPGSRKSLCRARGRSLPSGVAADDMIETCGDGSNESARKGCNSFVGRECERASVEEFVGKKCVAEDEKFWCARELQKRRREETRLAGWKPHEKERR
jgi:hypothetical protein